MLCKCCTCTYAIDSNIHDIDPCLLCTKRCHQCVALEHGDVSYVEQRAAERTEKVMAGMAKTKVAATGRKVQHKILSG